jgi:hypothetical protein
MITPDHIRRRAKEAQEEAQLATDPMVKARLHEIANELERLADEMEGLSDPDRRR